MQNSREKDSKATNYRMQDHEWFDILDDEGKSGEIHLFHGRHTLRIDTGYRVQYLKIWCNDPLHHCGGSEPAATIGVIQVHSTYIQFDVNVAGSTATVLWRYDHTTRHD